MTRGEIMIGVAEASVGGAADVLVTLALGSCVAIVLHDSEARVGGLAHVFLPQPVKAAAGEENPAKFAVTAVPHLLGRMEEHGGQRNRTVARLVGGASMFGHLLSASGLASGRRNVEAARDALRLEGVRIVGEATGGGHGRSVTFRPATGEVVVFGPDQQRLYL